MYIRLHTNHEYEESEKKMRLSLTLNSFTPMRCSKEKSHLNFHANHPTNEIAYLRNRAFGNN